jgi:dolichol-phosphate mannosyltransferase
MNGNRSKAVSVIVPTYKEAENLPLLIEGLQNIIEKQSLVIEMVIVDDNSSDGTEPLIAGLNKSWIKLLVRKKERGLSSAVVEGFSIASHPYLAVMDADMSHPPEAIPGMISALDEGYDFVLGSRYVTGSSTDESWGLLRWINSKIATLLAYPFTKVKDPMSGFFALKKETLQKAPYLNPIGYKIGLELIVKCNCQNILEIPIHFSNRIHGKSKLTFKQQLLYIQHLRRLFIFKYAEKSYVLQFIIVGISGIFVNLFTLTLLIWARVPSTWAIVAAIVVSVITNFLMNRRFTFSYARHRSFIKQFLGFAGAASVGAVVNFMVAIYLIHQCALCAAYPQLAALAGIVAGTGCNYLSNRFLVFKKA